MNTEIQENEEQEEDLLGTLRYVQTLIAKSKYRFALPSIGIAIYMVEKEMEREAEQRIISKLEERCEGDDQVVELFE